MIPLFFGSRQKQLFGVYHPSKRQPSLSHGVLLCPPVGHEYMRTHMALRQLALLLASSGFDVFRFDYYGVGDSSGTSEEATTETWQQDIAMAWQELKDMSGVQTISIAGLRLGAALAARAASTGLQAANLLLWDPVVKGADYIHELRKLTGEMVGGPVEYEDGRYEVLVGYPYSAKNLSLIKTIDLTARDMKAGKNVYLVVSGESESCKELFRRIKSPCNAEMKTIPAFDQNSNGSDTHRHATEVQSMIARWSSREEISQALIAHYAINEIASMLKKSA